MIKTRQKISNSSVGKYNKYVYNHLYKLNNYLNY